MERLDEEDDSERQTIRFRRKKFAKWVCRALQLKKIAKKQSADEVRNDPEGLALLQALFSNEEVKIGKWQDLLTKRIDAKTALLKRHDEATTQTRMKKWKAQSANHPQVDQMDEQQGPLPKTPTRLQ